MDDLVTCPYCGEEIEITLDEDGGSRQDYIEDCSVCCRPIQVLATVGEEGEPVVQLRRTDE